MSPPKNFISKIQDDFGIKWVGFCRFSHEGEDGRWRRQEVFCRGARRPLWWGCGVFREQLLGWRWLKTMCCTLWHIREMLLYKLANIGENSYYIQSDCIVGDGEKRLHGDCECWTKLSFFMFFGLTYNSQRELEEICSQHLMFLDWEGSLFTVSNKLKCNLFVCK